METKSETIEKPKRLLAGLVSEEELCVELDITAQTARKWRRLRTGPPYLTIGAAVYYPLDGFAAWLKSREKRPLRSASKRG
jgi:hypothetical protein